MRLATIAWAVALVASTLLPGCLEGPAAGARDPPVDDAGAARAEEALAPVPLSFEVLSRGSGPLVVAGLGWWRGNETHVLLGIHGSSGTKENNWGPLNVSGYSLAHRAVAAGHAFVAIDLPGYGDSRLGGVPGEAQDVLVSSDDYAFVTHQVTEALRAGAYVADDPRAFERVVGVGHSMGAAVVEEAAGLLKSFDAIVSLGWSHGARSTEPLTGDYTREEVLWHLENADPGVVEHMLATFHRQPLGVLDTYAKSFPPGGAKEVSRLVDVPVLLVLGEEDRIWVKEDMDRDAGAFSASPMADFVSLPETGHFILHHLNHREVQDAIARWLSTLPT